MISVKIDRKREKTQSAQKELNKNLLDILYIKDKGEKIEITLADNPNIK